uniref:Uncharacterized protein MANES_04G088100 n=1 Tax=Rhizophora mucronata TaxID=61149 RepID=A0A2P2MCL4_RHIMU
MGSYRTGMIWVTSGTMPFSVNLKLTPQIVRFYSPTLLLILQEIVKKWLKPCSRNTTFSVFSSKSKLF